MSSFSCMDSTHSSGRLPSDLPRSLTIPISGAAPVLFTWPSRGGVLNYNYDKESATFSRSDLAYVLRTAAENPAVADITLLAHSMGAWIAMEAVRQIALEDKGDLAKIDNIVLASPDIDVDVFRRHWITFGPDRPLITVFTSVRDRALGISSIVAGGVARVGRVEVEDASYQKTFGQIPKLVFIDISRIRGETRLNHSTFATSSEDCSADRPTSFGGSTDDGQRPCEPCRRGCHAQNRRPDACLDAVSHPDAGSSQ